MELKQYQRRVVEEVEGYLVRVGKERAEGNRKHAAADAWKGLRKIKPLGEYSERENGLEEDLPSFCIKVPTGGGKTLLATQALGSIYRTILRERNGAGLVLWVVPSSQIYRDTLRRLKDRRDLYRVMLEHAVSRRIEVWEKDEIARLSPVRLRDCLNILVVQLASTNRETKEQLKFFQDSGGNIVQHFPAENDWAAQKELLEQCPNLDMLEADEESGRFLAKTSVGNLVKLCRPAVIVDEGHKATSELARKTIEAFNASVVIELSATPRPGANVLTKVSGKELLDEEMIKLPMNISTSRQKNWKDVLTQARDKRLALSEKAAELLSDEPDRLIRPIVLVQVERTGKDQVDAGLIHSEQVKQYLMERLSVPETAIAIKSAAKDDIEGIDLDDPECPIEWIITKSALQEGWDCPNAYILVSLANTQSGLNMTQLVGRVLRQPYQRRTPVQDLNESYIFCLHERAGDVSRQVKKALEQEGYEGEAASLVVSTAAGNDRAERTAKIQPRFLNFAKKPFEGKIYLPHFCVKEGKSYERLDWFQHLLARVDVEAFRYAKARTWDLQADLKDAKERFIRVTLGEPAVQQSETEIDYWEDDESVRRWMVASLKFDYLSQKQLRRIVSLVYEPLVKGQLYLKGHLALVKFIVRERVERLIHEEIEEQTREAFETLHRERRLRFYLECQHCRFEIPESIQVRVTQPMAHHNGDRLQRSLFDYVDDDSANSYEKAIALCLDRDANVLWWYRNLVAADCFSIQGFRKDRIRPDFVVHGGKDDQPIPRVLVLEGKGDQLKGNDDTTYKRRVADVFNEVGHKVSWQQLAEDFEDHQFRFQILDEKGTEPWQDALRTMLAE